MASGGRGGKEGAAKAGEVGWAACGWVECFQAAYCVRLRQPETQFSVAKTSHARFCKAKTEGKRSKHGKQRKQDFQAASTPLSKS